MLQNILKRHILQNMYVEKKKKKLVKKIRKNLD